MAGRLDEEQTAVNTGILDVPVTLSGKLLAEVCGVLILDVFHDGIPASSTLARLQMLRVHIYYHLSLLTWSPYPGVSTMLRRRRTPFSSMTRNEAVSSARSETAMA